MPQMACLWWDMLFIYFMLSFLMMSTMIYFITYNDNNLICKEKNTGLLENQMNWKW
uniref:ATP synthase complex subunit 8 n=1 Tax=Idiostolus sp. TaxID=2931296 RepID=A0A8T9ZYC6_9HEMI|nr:ATPase subunit 8 [Idiostolus sp.]